MLAIYIYIYDAAVAVQQQGGLGESEREGWGRGGPRNFFGIWISRIYITYTYTRVSLEFCLSSISILFGQRLGWSLPPSYYSLLLNGFSGSIRFSGPWQSSLTTKKIQIKSKYNTNLIYIFIFNSLIFKIKFLIKFYKNILFIIQIFLLNFIRKYIRLVIKVSSIPRNLIK